MNKSALSTHTDAFFCIFQEKYYQTIFFVVFKLLGCYIEAESCTNEGRIDAYIRTSKTVYIFEFKLDKTADEALKQIEEKGYARPFATDQRPLYKIGVNFSSTKRCVDGWQVVKA